jgi:hypothetical protein
MTPDPLDNPQFISGIHNYCDRWCERCGFTSRCSSYAMEKAFEEEAESPDAGQQLHLKALDDHLSWTLDAGPEDADPDETEDIDDLAEMMSAERSFEDQMERRAHEEHDCSSTARMYLDMSRKWLKDSGAGDDDRSGRTSDAFWADVEQSARAQAGEALEVIQWYQFFIYVKLMRAVSGLSSVPPAPGLEDYKAQDANGSAKIALIGIDRSIAAWEVLVNAAPRHRGAMSKLLAQLTGLRQAAEETFPQARAFVRPGFDEMQSG